MKRKFCEFCYKPAPGEEHGRLRREDRQAGWRGMWDLRVCKECWDKAQRMGGIQNLERGQFSFFKKFSCVRGVL